MTSATRDEASLTPRELMSIQVATLFTLDANERLLRVNEPNGKAAPRFFLGRTSHGNVWRFRHDLDESLVRALDGLCRSETGGADLLSPPYGATKFAELLAQAAPVQHVEAGPAFHFPRTLEPTSTETVLVTHENVDVLRPYHTAWLGDVAHCQPFMAVLCDGHAASVCGTVRVGSRAYEAGVETHPEFRGRGYAAAVATAWALAVRALDRIPLYSTSWENSASRAVARKLGLVQYGADLHIN